MPRILLPVIAAAALTSLGACAPAAQSTASNDPVFAPGQMWKADWGDATSQTLTVPPLDVSTRGTYGYKAVSSPGVMTLFWYDPVDSDPEFIQVAVIDSATKRNCLVLNPGKVALNEPRQGMYTYDASTAGTSAATLAYLKNGDLAGALSCTLTRLK